MESLSRYILIFICLVLACSDTKDVQSTPDSDVNGSADLGVADSFVVDATPALDLSLADSFIADANVPESDQGGQAQTCEAWRGLAGEPLVQDLHRYLSEMYVPIQPTPNFGGTPDRYTTARQLMFTRVYRFENDEGTFVVECVYTQDQAFTPPDRDPDDELINCEHLWPRARLNADRSSALYEHQQSDIHHLVPARPSANSLRGSFKFGEVVRDRNLDAAPSIFGKNDRGDQVFEPHDPMKGDIARALFYMSVRWGLAIASDEETVLRRWHAQDPVEQHEVAKNDVIEGIQGNRNPFVDCPSLVDDIQDFQAFDITDSPESLPLP